MYNGSIINESATLAFAVKGSLTGGAFTAVKFSDTGVVTATAGDIPIGCIIKKWTRWERNDKNL